MSPWGPWLWEGLWGPVDRGLNPNCDAPGLCHLGPAASPLWAGYWGGPAGGMTPLGEKSVRSPTVCRAAAEQTLNKFSFLPSGAQTKLVLVVGGGEKAATVWGCPARRGALGGAGMVPGFKSACPLETAPTGQDLLASAAHSVIPLMLPRNIYRSRVHVPGSGVHRAGGLLWHSWWRRGRQAVMTQPSTPLASCLLTPGIRGKSRSCRRFLRQSVQNAN